jgi:oxygen-independent coproporphyrinogen-3 oxidase
MIDAICMELKLRSTEIANEKIETIYFGGGTPSLLTEKEFAQIFEAIHTNYAVLNAGEITLEANPDDIQTLSLQSWKRLGFHRLSIGLQSFREKDLKWMNRAHNAEEAKNCVALAKKEGFDSISVDLIYGLPDLDLETWKNHIETAVGFGVDHISSYCLTVEEKTLLQKKVNDGAIIPSNEDEQAKQFELLQSILTESGFHQYEVSNFSLPGKEAKHNSSYWKGVHYLGIGPSAHSFDGKTRRYNVSNNTQYIRRLNENKDYFEIEVLTTANQFNELLMTGLRTIWGVDLAKLESILPLTDDFKRILKGFKDKNWIEQKNNHLYLKGDGWLMADFIVAELFEY